jgi:hypothetical protein
MPEILWHRRTIMTQQYVSEGLAFESNAMPHGQGEALEGGDEATIDRLIHASIQGGSPKSKSIPDKGTQKRRT